MSDGGAEQTTSPDDMLKQLGDEVADILRRLVKRRVAADGSRRKQPGSLSQLGEELEDVIWRLTGKLSARSSSATHA
jgi:hypothetical protein